MIKYGFQFSLKGLLLYTLQLLPNIIWMLVPPANNVLTGNSSTHKTLNIIEGLFGVLTVILMVVLINKGEGSNSNLYIGLAVLFLAAYYISWMLYYNGVVAPWLLILGIASMPPLYFFFVGLWMKNYLLLVPCAIFGITHILITSMNFLRP
ncbi:hypothetical protein MHH60_32265 [Paenibacillus sp. FSL H7-0716]|uniref:Uncharacterized protein n=1 Tax=Paenibacillus odorifer TaxID=189426 RepID=A0A1R0YTY8_9BACL|nr:hypothetical protein [Paenibacillus odorifer]AWV31584.1 hypothetical protein CD191_02510 [Paenibacillus odorifer]OME10503.1 hypothetical protein BSK60_24915 [Paenibacillus odorifer]OME12914.1 hypothetical protein BSK47_26090 [Paenibacillus odorifer]